MAKRPVREFFHCILAVVGLGIIIYLLSHVGQKFEMPLVVLFVILLYFFACSVND